MKTHARNLQTIQKKYEDSQKAIEKQKLKIEILEAEKLTLQAENKTLEVRFEDVNLKLKLKTAEYDSLLAKQEKDAQQCTAHQQSEPIVIDDVELIKMGKSVPRKKPTPKPRKLKASEISISDSDNKENSVDNSDKMTRSR